MNSVLEKMRDHIHKLPPDRKEDLIWERGNPFDGVNPLDYSNLARRSGMSLGVVVTYQDGETLKSWLARLKQSKRKATFLSENMTDGILIFWAREPDSRMDHAAFTMLRTLTANGNIDATPNG